MRTFATVTASLLLLLVQIEPLNAQSQEVAVTSAPIPQRLDVRFRLFPTANIWNFLLLDTSDGRVWQVQYGLADSTPAGRWVVNAKPLVVTANAKPGRFTIYATHNMFNFVVLDQEDGRAWQMQWSLEAAKRGMIHDLSAELR
jgi:hypothetical protein